MIVAFSAQNRRLLKSLVAEGILTEEQLEIVERALLDILSSMIFY